MSRIMVDLETLGTAPGSVILSIGAVRFDVEKGLLDEFYVNIDVESSQRLGLTIDGDTVMWWLKQSDAARAKCRTPFNIPARVQGRRCERNIACMDPNELQRLLVNMIRLGTAIFGKRLYPEKKA